MERAELEKGSQELQYVFIDHVRRGSLQTFYTV